MCKAPVDEGAATKARFQFFFFFLFYLDFCRAYVAATMGWRWSTEQDLLLQFQGSLCTTAASHHWRSIKLTLKLFTCQLGGKSRAQTANAERAETKLEIN